MFVEGVVCGMLCGGCGVLRVCGGCGVLWRVCAVLCGDGVVWRVCCVVCCVEVWCAVWPAGCVDGCPYWTCSFLCAVELLSGGSEGTQVEERCGVLSCS